MYAELVSHLAVADLQWHGGPGQWGDGRPGWWIVFPLLFWTVALTAVGLLLYRRSPARSARSSAQRTLADRYARGEIDEAEFTQRSQVLRGKA